jgi:L-fuconate dehydratase
VSDEAAFTSVEVVDLRCPTSQHLDGSDAMNPDPDYSAGIRHAENRRR